MPSPTQAADATGPDAGGDDVSGPAIRLSALTKTYGSGDAEVDALRGVDLEIERGRFVVLLGPSGSGKTTLLNVVGGIEPATSGTVVVDGIDVGSLDRRGLTAYRRDHVGFVFQFFNLIPTLTARENVELLLEITDADRAAPTDVLLEQVGLTDRADRFPSALSGGQQQRVAIARAVSKTSPLLLCDEPTGSLDLDTGRQVLELLHEVRGDDHRTVLVVTHNSTIAEMADRVLHLRDGKIVADETVDSPVHPRDLEW